MYRGKNIGKKSSENCNQYFTKLLQNHATSVSYNFEARSVKFYIYFAFQININLHCNVYIENSIYMLCFVIVMKCDEIGNRWWLMFHSFVFMLFLINYDCSWVNNSQWIIYPEADSESDCWIRENRSGSDLMLLPGSWFLFKVWLIHWISDRRF